MLKEFRYSDTQKKQIIKSLTILHDTREQRNQHILEYFDKKGIPHKKRALQQGDYSFMIPKNEKLSIPRDLMFDKEIIIERKGSLDEVAGNLTNKTNKQTGEILDHRDRFEKELTLAPNNKILLIENADYGDLSEARYRSEYNNQAFLASLHTFWWRYNLPIFFMKNNKYSGEFIYKTFGYYFKTIILR